MIGSNGSAAGQLAGATGVAFDGAGNLYVAELGNSRISVFSGGGTFLRAFGWGVDTGMPQPEVCTTASGCQFGTSGGGAGQLDQPYAITIDGSGTVYVAEGNNSRISAFTAGGAFIRAFGRGVLTGGTASEICTAATTCQSGVVTGAGVAGEVNFPHGLDVDSQGNLYVGDTGHHRISIFSTAGSFIRAFGRGVNTGANTFEVCTAISECNAGTASSAAGGLNEPRGVAIDDAGNLYVAMSGSSRIDVFDVDTVTPTFVHAFGLGVDPDVGSPFEVCTTGSGCTTGITDGEAGAIDFPTDVELDGSGRAYVSSLGDYRIDVFNTSPPSFLHAFGWNVSQFFGGDAFRVCTLASGCQQGTQGSGAGQINLVEALTVDCRGAVWVSDTNESRVQRFGEPGTPLPPCTSPPVAPPVQTTPIVPVAPVVPAAKKCRKGSKLKRGKCVKKKAKKR